MADEENTNMGVDKGKDEPFSKTVKPLIDEVLRRIGGQSNAENKSDPADSCSTTEYCERLQAWMWQYYSGYVHWQSWLAATAMYPYSMQLPNSMSMPHMDLNTHTWHTGPGLALSPYSPGAPSSTSRAGEAAPGAAAPTQRPHEEANVQRPGREYSIPSPLQRLFAEMVDFFILFFIKATIIISIMHLSGIKDVSKFAMHFIVEEIDEDTSMEELQKMMLVALVYRILVCFYEIVCIWGAGGATPGKFLVGLRVVTCDSSVLVQPNRVFVVPATNVSFSASTVRALNKNFSIAFFFPAFITLLFFQHNRTVYDMVAGTIVVKRSRVR
ncbi:protein FAM8A1-like [Periophthalmus magnuspinnatus]|uniref:RDD domain-containing protein n=1 Tax=Periophthalmus magnuspinnatus TaxID=409849 RepID=A0A3B4AHJ8_9GOBI|nr:protein FAM8A1-like [Periophthalmus magnuspinnatus]